MIDKDINFDCLNVEITPMVNEENIGRNSPLVPVEYICPTCHKRWIDYGIPNECPYCRQLINPEFRGNPSYYNWDRIDETKILHNPNGRYIVVCKHISPPLYVNVPYFAEIYGDRVYFYNNETHDHRIGEFEYTSNVRILANDEITEETYKLATCFGRIANSKKFRLMDEIKRAYKTAYKMSKNKEEFYFLADKMIATICY